MNWFLYSFNGQTLGRGLAKGAGGGGAMTRTTTSSGVSTYEGQRGLGSSRFGKGWSSTSNGRSIEAVLMVRPPPEPPPWFERDDRVREIYFISYCYFIVWILAKVYVVMVTGMIENLAYFYVAKSIQMD
ncbi:unnamed protein product [Cuscuta epithymum]|uniref:Uncharacterized protein n=1 Tax=Cuscuta epithymum TaxID=186058 RepID=A0AAV0E6V5_9ASTE|nr:unnamed protein product [Cuscuta epithymum]